MTALPWHHSDAKAAAAALGLAPAQVSRLRRQGAPWPTTGTIDELAVRLWNRDQEKPLPLPAPTGALEPYAEWLAPRIVDEADPADVDPLKAARAENEALKVAARKEVLIKKGQAAASAVVNDAERTLLQQAPALATDLWTLAHDKSRHQAEPILIRTLKTRISGAIRQALAKVK